VSVEPITRVAVATIEAGDAEVPALARNAPGGIHPVVEGDNLWDIAGTKLGDPHRWREIYTLNRGHVQANGHALTDPDVIHVGWVLALPARDAATAPVDPAPGGSASAEQSPDGGPSAVPSGPPASATPSPSTGASGSSTPTPSGSVSSPSEPSMPADVPSPDGTDAQPHSDETGITLPVEGWISLGLAATISAVAAMLRLQRRRRARLIPVPVSAAPQPAPVPPSLARVDAVGNRHLGKDTTVGYLPTGPALPAPVGVDDDGAEVSLFTTPGAGLAVHGEGAIPVARAALACVLSTGATDSVDARPVVVTTTDLLARLLPEGLPVVGLDPDGTAFDGERLIVLADTTAAVTHFEEEMIGRRRLLDTFDADTVTDLNARTDHAEMQPPYVLLIEATDRHAARLRAVAAHRATLDLHPVLIGTLDGFPAVEVAADGNATSTADDASSAVARWATLGAPDLAAVLAMLTDALARPEAGTDVDDPPAEPMQIAASAESIPAQRKDAAALVQLRVLGPVTVATDAGPVATGMRSGSYTALALLAAHPAGRTLDQLAAALHPDTDKNLAVKRVRTDITTARRVLRGATGHDEPMFIIYDQTTGRYRIDPDTVAVDLWQMLTAIERANIADRERNEGGDAAALAALRQAAELYNGDFADGHDRTWALDYATTYRHQILTVYARIAEILEADHPDQAVAALEHAVELDPVNEELYQRIMRIHGRQQRPDAVRRTLRRLEERLADLGDAEPSQATRRLAERQLRPAAPVSGGQR
jgi:DNA-binding SARP family transcriptional activator